MATKGMTLFMYFFSSGSAPNSLAITLLSGRAALLLYTQQDKEKKTGDTKWQTSGPSHESRDHLMGKWAYVTSLDVIASPCSTCRVRIRRCAATVGSSWLRRWCSGRVSPELWNHPSVPLKNTHTQRRISDRVPACRRTLRLNFKRQVCEVVDSQDEDLWTYLMWRLSNPLWISLSSPARFCLSGVDVAEY